MVKQVYNLTPHNIDICDKHLDWIKTIEPDGLVVRAEMEEEIWCKLNTGYSTIPVWSIQVTNPTIEENPFAPRRIGTPIGKTTKIFIIVSRTAADAILKDNEETNVIWDYVWEGVKQINVLTVHKSQKNKDTGEYFDRETGERYGALGFALQGQIGR